MSQPCPRCGIPARALTFGGKLLSVVCPQCGKIGAEECSSTSASNGSNGASYITPAPALEPIPFASSFGASPDSSPFLPALPAVNGYANGASTTDPQAISSIELEKWHARIFQNAEWLLRDDPEYQKNIPAKELLEPLINDLLQYVDISRSDGKPPPRGLSAGDIKEDVERYARLAIETWCGFRIWSKDHLPAEVEPEPRRSSIIVETYEIAEATNAEYLARPEVIERLGYSQSILLMIGGKHHGKTTNIRTLVMSTLRGLPVWERKTTQGPVVYAASDDEVASTRYQLLEMGWRGGKDPLHFAHINPDSDATPEQVLEDIAELAVQTKAIMIVLDMLFDFVGIKDELSYAGTRAATGMVQRLADRTRCLVVGSHHTPKYLTDVHSAANAALGSQGISARFSPIVLTRQWTDRLYSIESTMTRDPRGLAIPQTCITKTEAGWIELGQPFKEWMKWELYADRVMGLFEGGDPNEGYTVFEVAEKLELNRARAQTVLQQLTMTAPPKLVREKRSRAYRYYLASSDMFEREGGNFEADV